jgi:cytochrome c oxidase subunit 1
MPRRTANYPLLPGNVTTLNIISTVGSWILAVSILMFLWNVYVTTRYGQRVTEEDPWGFCSSLEWATSCPPPRHNFYRIPRIRSDRPAFEAHYPLAVGHGPAKDGTVEDGTLRGDEPPR